MTTAGSYDFNGYQVLVVGGTRGEGHRIASAFATSGASVTVTGTMMLRSLYDTDLSAFDYESVNLARQDSIDHLVGTIDHIDVLVLAASCNLPYGLPPDEQAFITEAARSGLLGPTFLTTRLRLKLGQSPALGGGCVVNTGAVTQLAASSPAPRRRPSASWPSPTARAGRNWAGLGVQGQLRAPGGPHRAPPAVRAERRPGRRQPGRRRHPGPQPAPRRRRRHRRHAVPREQRRLPHHRADPPHQLTRGTGRPCVLGNISESPREAVCRGYISPTRKPHGTYRTRRRLGPAAPLVHSEGRPLDRRTGHPAPTRAGRLLDRTCLPAGPRAAPRAVAGAWLARRRAVGLPRRGAGGHRRPVGGAARDGRR